jgi:hypothetical protein
VGHKIVLSYLFLHISGNKMAFVGNHCEEAIPDAVGAPILLDYW